MRYDAGNVAPLPSGAMDEDLAELVWWAVACVAMVAYGLLIR